MKKAIIAILFLILTISPLLAVTGKAGVNPQSGGFGIDMASDDYRGGTSSWSDSDVTGAESATSYSPKQHVAIGGVWNMEATGGDPDHFWSNEYDFSECRTPMTISASCPNGFYFESISNEGARRPFKIFLRIGTSYSHDPNQSGGTGTKYLPSSILLEEGNNSKTFYYTELQSDEKIRQEWTTNLLNHYQYMWFDVILYLPADDYDNPVSSTGVLRVNEQIYNLVEADDYFAPLTISVDWGTDHKEITIPLSGYYSRNPQNDIDSHTSLYVRPKAAASNLSIERNRGEVAVGEISFMSNLNGADYRLFLSASNDPTVQVSRGFELVHSDVDFNDAHTSENSIGFTINLVNTENNETTVFDGRGWLNGNSIEGESIEITVCPHEGTGSPVNYGNFEGEMRVVIDEPPVIMHEGQYLGNVYIHVVDMGA